LATDHSKPRAVRIEPSAHGGPRAADDERYLDAAVELTRHREPQSLAHALLAALCEIVPARRVRLLAIENENRDTEFYEANVEAAIVHDLLDSEPVDPRFLANDADLMACVRTQAPVERNAPERRAVFPIFGANHVWALLLIEGIKDALPRDRLTKLLRIYSNQTFILSRSQLDPLTGLFNRQSFYDRIRQVASRSTVERRNRNGESPGHCFALLDIDHFKLVNDRYGHLYGDEVLLLMARLMTRSFRHEDLLFRYGGEEFAVVLVNVDLESAERLLERFRRAVETYAFPRLEPKTMSMGYTSLSVEGGADKVVMCADKALYYAKNNGRNQVCCYERLIAEGKLEPVTVAEGDIELF
jgi:diguanylate cyclase (GGDEF)-like protein